MTSSTVPAYYLMILGGCLTVTSSLSVFFRPYIYSTYLSYAFLIPLLLGTGTIYLAHLIHTGSSKGYVRGIIVAALSLIALWFLPGSFTNLFFSGPPLSFAGGIISELSTRQTRQETVLAPQ